MRLTGTVYGANEAELEANAKAAASQLFADKAVDVYIGDATIEEVTTNHDGTIQAIKFAAEFEAMAR